jgi:hypothetical protein
LRTSPPAAPFRKGPVVPHINPASPRVGLAPDQYWVDHIISSVRVASFAELAQAIAAAAFITYASGQHPR